MSAALALAAAPLRPRGVSRSPRAELLTLTNSRTGTFGRPRGGALGDDPSAGSDAGPKGAAYLRLSALPVDAGMDMSTLGTFLAAACAGVFVVDDALAAPAQSTLGWSNKMYPDPVPSDRVLPE